MFPSRLVLAALLAFTAAAPAAAPATRLTRPPATQLLPAPRLTRPSTAPATADAFLQTAPALRDRIAWVTGNGGRVDYVNWSPAQKARLELFYRRMATGQSDLTMKLPTEKIDGGGNFYFTADVAFDVFAAHVAHVIYVEAHHLVPWSILTHTAGEIDELVNSNAYFGRIAASQRTDYPAGIQADRDFQEIAAEDRLGEIIGDPRVGYDFLSGKTSATHQSLVGKTELETLANLSLWLRDNVTHGPMDGKTRERVKTQRFLEQRLQPGKGSKTAIAVQGCHSSAKLLLDLARSVNIPLLNLLSLDPTLSEQDGSFFSHTHGSLIYNWESGPTRVIWHVDEINAMPGSTCFPIDPKTGALATPDVAKQMFFDELWVTPQRLIQAGFNYDIQRVYPGKGFGAVTAGAYEDRQEYGFACGSWKRKGKSDLSSLFQLEHDYALCGDPQLSMQANSILDVWLTDNIKSYLGDLPKADLPALRPISDYVTRATAGLKALGGAAQFAKKEKEYEASRGNNLLVPGASR